MRAKKQISDGFTMFLQFLAGLLVFLFVGNIGSNGKNITGLFISNDPLILTAGIRIWKIMIYGGSAFFSLLIIILIYRKFRIIIQNRKVFK